MTIRWTRLSLLAVVLVTATSASAATRTIKRDLGGVIDNYESAYEKGAKRGTRYVIEDLCASSCTLILGVIPKERVCVSDKAQLGFHSAYYDWLFWRRHSKAATQRLWDFYPPEVQAELIATYFWNGGLGQKHLDMIWIKASRFYPICGHPVVGPTPSTKKD